MVNGKRYPDWLFNKLRRVQGKNKRLREQLLDTDKQNIHIRPDDWKKVLEDAKKWNELENSKTHEALVQYAKDRQIVKRLEERQEKWKKSSRMTEEQIYAFDELQKILDVTKGDIEGKEEVRTDGDRELGRFY